MQRFGPAQHDNEMTVGAEPGSAGFSQELAGRLRKGWPDAVRMVLAAVGSYALSQVLHLPEAFWAVLTSLVATRPHAAGTARAGVDRLIGTVAGAAVATAFALTHLHLTQLELLFAVLVPLCLLVAVHENYRAAPVAALIVLSGGMMGGSPLNTALYRTSEIAVGALVAFIVSALVLPNRGDDKAFGHAASVAKYLSRLVGVALLPQEGAETFSEHLKETLRAELRQLAMLTHYSRWRRAAETNVSKLARLMSALNADVGFIERTIVRSPVKEEAVAFDAPLREIVAAFQSVLNQAAQALAGDAPVPRIETIDRAIDAIDARSEAPSSPQHLLFLLRTLREDCRKLCLLLAASERER